MRILKIAVLIFVCIGSLTGCTWQDPQEMMITPMTTIEQSSPNVHINVEESVSYEAEMLEIALSYKTLIEKMDKGTSHNTVISDDSIAEIVKHLASFGYTVTAYMQDMENHQPFEDFLLGAMNGQDGSAHYYRVGSDGGFIRYEYRSEDNRLYLSSQYLTWDDSLNPSVTSPDGLFVIEEWTYTEKGFLIYEANSTPKRCSVQRIKPLGEKKRVLGKAYILPVNYVGSNLFLIDWSRPDMDGVALNDLYEALLYMETGKWLAYDLFVDRVSAEEFEPLFVKYFDVSVEFLRENSLYYQDENAYFWNYLTSTKHDILYPAPVPEVVDNWENEDGTTTMVVDALDDYYGDDRAFTHEVTVLVREDGSFHYISNHIWPEDIEKVPSYTPRWVQLDPFSELDTP